jgi:hypothetical protein
MSNVAINNSEQIWKTPHGKRYTGSAFIPDTKDEVYLTYYTEEQVLSSLFMHRFAEELGHDIITPVLDILKPEHFSDAQFKGWRYLLYKAISESGLHTDPVNICKWLVDNNLFQKGMDDYIELVCSYNITSLDAEHYANAVIGYYSKRSGNQDAGLSNRRVITL